MNKLLIGFVFSACLICCNNKEEDSTKAYFSVVDYLKAEVTKMDTLPLHFKKITTADGASDTSMTTKEEFHKYANEFLSIPDIASGDKKQNYAETNDFDEILGNVLLIYTAKKPEDEVRNETVMMQPDDQGNTHVKTIIVTTLNTDTDLTTEKNMTWHINKRFQIVTKTNKANQPEKITTTVISWE